MANHISCVFCAGQALSLSDTEHGWAHSSNAVYLVIHRLTGTSIELQPCIGMSWYDLNSNVALVCTNKAQIYSIKKETLRYHLVIFGGISLQSIFYCKSGPFVIQNRYTSFRPQTVQKLNVTKLDFLCFSH